MHFTCRLKSKVNLKRCRMGILSNENSDQGEQLQYMCLREVIPVGQTNNCWTKYFRAFLCSCKRYIVENCKVFPEKEQCIGNARELQTTQQLEFCYTILRCPELHYSSLDLQKCFIFCCFLSYRIRVHLNLEKIFYSYTSSFQRKCVHCSNVKFFKMWLSF